MGGAYRGMARFWIICAILRTRGNAFCVGVLRKEACGLVSEVLDGWGVLGELVIPSDQRWNLWLGVVLPKVGKVLEWASF